MRICGVVPSAIAKPPSERWRNRIVGEGVEAPDQLLANRYNWRIHPRHQQVALEASLDSLGWIQRIIVNRRTGYVLDGHARVAAAITAGEEAVPVVYVDLTEAEELQALATLDPISAMAGADREMLTGLLKGLRSESDGVQVLIEAVAHDNKVDLVEPEFTDLDAVPDAREPITQPGDMWLLGDHRLLCGDATKAEDVGRVLEGVKPGVIIADPPYGIDLDTDYSWMKSPWNTGKDRRRGGGVSESGG